MSKRTVLAIVALAFLFVGLVLYSTMSGAHERVEVCMEFQGRSACRTARGNTREQAVRTAASNACAFLASGMTDSIACERSKPVSVTLLEGK